MPHTDRHAPPHHAAQLQRSAIARAVFWASAIGVLAGAVGSGVAMGLATRWAWQDGQAGVQQVQVLSQGQQIATAGQLMRSEQDGDRTLQELRDAGYLKEVPTGWRDGEAQGLVELPGVSSRACARINERAGLTDERKVVKRVANPEREQTADFGCIRETGTVFLKY